MKYFPRLLCALLICALCVSGYFVAAQTKAAPARQAGSATVRLDFKDLRLSSGLRVIIAEDHTAPVVSLALTYNVGSRNERQGRTGFAHLFEHTMFKGSENVDTGEHMYLVFNNGGSPGLGG